MTTNSNNSTASSGGVGFAGLLTVLFIGLKLGHVITWSWWWILSPLWISGLLFAAVLIVIVAVAVIVAVVKR